MEDAAIDGANTAWIMTTTALVLFMTLPGLALFYAGLVRARNVLSVFMQTIAVAALMSVLWLAFGYSIAFGEGGALFGDFSKVFLLGVSEQSVTGDLPEYVFFAFQMSFAIITPALIIGAYVERINFAYCLAFSAAWMLLVYAPVVHWIWHENGWAFKLGVTDLAGGIVVHETAGIAAIIIAIALGPRKDKARPPHNPGYVFLGASMLWVGWFGFNAGSVLAANGAAAKALLVTHISAASASLSWAFWEWRKYGKASLVGLVTGTIAGLASITPASGSVGPIWALIIGGVAGVLCQEMVNLIKHRLEIDDSLDVFAVHGVGGIFGTIMIAVAGAASFKAQLLGLLGVGIYTALVSAAIIYGLKAVMAIRVDEEAEYSGLDIASHGERAYDHVS